MLTSVFDAQALGEKLIGAGSKAVLYLQEANLLPELEKLGSLWRLPVQLVTA